MNIYSGLAYVISYLFIKAVNVFKHQKRLSSLQRIVCFHINMIKAFTTQDKNPQTRIACQITLAVRAFYFSVHITWSNRAIYFS